jgi:DNA polymerase-3 subunit delta
MRAEQLEGHLRRGALSRLYTVTGDDALLCREALDALRGAARAQGYGERQVLQLDARSDWSVLDAAGQELSLFASRRLVEVRLPSGKPGKTGGEALRRLAARSDADTLSIVVLPRLDRTTAGTAWAQSLHAAGAWVEVATVEREHLAPWIAARLAREGLRTDAATLEFLADRFEGNLLAAQQEIEKLAILHPPGELAADQVRSAIFDVARYDIFDLPGALLSGDAARAIRLVAGLRAEGEPLPLVVWAVADELRSLLRLRSEVDCGTPLAVAARRVRLNTPLAMVERVLARVPARRLAALLARCARIDRIAKGLHTPGASEDPWVELTRLALVLQDRSAH